MSLSWLESIAPTWLGDLQAVADANGKTVGTCDECAELMREYLRMAWIEGATLRAEPGTGQPGC